MMVKEANSPTEQKTGEIPVLLLTGYLGSGKTTLVNRILANQHNIKFAVIVNDIGEVNIDASLIQQGGVVGQDDKSLIALQNGCICCTLRMDLVEQLCDIANTGRFDYIVIEASGICEPAPIAQTISSITDIVPGFIKKARPTLDCIVSVVDALRLQKEFDNGQTLQRTNIAEDDLENLVIQQIEFCNLILLNKATEVSTGDLGRIREILHTIQPEAEIIPCDYCDVPLSRLIHTHQFDFDKVAGSAAWIKAIEGEDQGCPIPQNKDEGEREEYGITTFVYQRRPAFNLGRFDEFVSGNAMKKVIRCKGTCWFYDEPDNCYIFEQAGSQTTLRNAGQWYATMPEEELRQRLQEDESLRRDWDEKYGDRMEKLVFIGQDLDREALVKVLDACMEEPDDAPYTIRKATIDDCQLIHNMAEQVFPKTYKSILSPEQNDYMMDWMYSLPNLYRQITEQHHTYLILSVNHEPAGYSSVQPEGEDVYHLQKLYILPKYQGIHLGGRLFTETLKYIKSIHKDPCRVELNVNRSNQAVGFYLHMGMKKIREGNFPIGHDFFMNDYIMSIDL
jgi:G3E family GTPase/ribosomal protein S18 acetylase RimI-like enzyme